MQADADRRKLPPADAGRGSRTKPGPRRAWRLGTTILLGVGLGLAVACASRPTATRAGAAARPAPAGPDPPVAFVQIEPLDLVDQFVGQDRILFVGDEVTQQMFYTRSLATALLGLEPTLDLRFYNGGYEGAAATAPTPWLDSLLDLSRPTAVFVCLGLNDVRDRRPLPDLVAAYERGLGAIVERIRAATGDEAPPRIVLVSPLPHESAVPTTGALAGENVVLHALALGAQRAAAATGCDFIDIFVPMLRVYADSGTLPEARDRLTYDGRLPNESGHVVLASMLLYGMGVNTSDLDRVGWSPLLPVKMGRLRGALGLPLAPVSAERAERSRSVYAALQPFDEAFFASWRLSSGREGLPREARMARPDAAWGRVRQATAAYR